jgi:hypothetical protein
MITPAQILLGKLIVSLRVSGVLTAFLMFPPLLAMLMLDSYWTNWDSMVAYFAIIALTCVMDSVIALFCSVCFRRTSISQMVSYMLILLLFAAPVALMQLLRILDLHSSLEWAQWTQVFSPFAAAFAVPLDRQMLATATDMANSGNLYLLTSYFAGTASLIIVLLVLMVFLFERRWWIGQS